MKMTALIDSLQRELSNVKPTGGVSSIDYIAIAIIIPLKIIFVVVSNT